MYEIWLGLNIFYEIAVANGVALVIVAIAWLALMVIAVLRGRANWKPAVVPAILAGAISVVSVIITLPGMTKSSFADLGYWVDWATLAGLSLAAGAIAIAFAWPAAATLLRRPD